MTTQTLERNIHRPQPTGRGVHTANRYRRDPSASAVAQLDESPVELDFEAELQTLATKPIEFISDRDELGQRIMTSAMASERETFAVKCRSVSHATDFATQMRSTLLALNSGFGGISVTVSPSLNLNTWPAMDAMVAALKESGAGELWQPIGERSIALGAARHVFVSVDHPIRNDATRVFPNVLVEVVGAHLIDPEWFDTVVAPRCGDESLTFVFYGQQGFSGSLFERAWQESRIQGRV